MKSMMRLILQLVLIGVLLRAPHVDSLKIFEARRTTTLKTTRGTTTTTSKPAPAPANNRGTTSSSSAPPQSASNFDPTVDSSPAPPVPAPAVFDSADALYPAFKIHLTTKGLNFVSRIAKTLLLDFLKDGSGKSIETKNTDGATLKWNNLKIQKYNDDMKSDVVFSPGIGVEYRLRDLNVKMSSDFTVVQSTTTSTSKSPSGVLTVTMNGVAVSLIISMINSQGRMKPVLEDCRSTIDSADLQIPQGSSTELAKYFHDDVINTQAKSFLQREICSFAKTVFVPKIERTFANYQTTTNVFDNVYYNYSLTDDPQVNSDSVVTSYAGNAYMKQPNGQIDSKIPFTAPPVLDENKQDRMMVLFMSNYSLRSLVYFMGKQHRFDYNFTKQDTPSFAKYLRTDCGKDEMCASSVISSLPKKYPNSYLEIYIRQIPGREKCLITKDLVNMTGESYVNGYVRLPNNKKEWLFYSNIESYTTMKKPVFIGSNQSIETKLDSNHFRLYNFSAASPDVTADSLSLLTGFAMDNFVTEDMKRTLGRGLKLPKLIEFDMVNGVAAFEEGRIMMGADFCQTPDECKAAEQAAAKEQPKKPDYDELYEG